MICNVQEASAAGTKLVLYVPFCECMSPDMQQSFALPVGSLSERGEYYITMYSHSPVNKLLRLGLKSCISHHLCSNELVL